MKLRISEFFDDKLGQKVLTEIDVPEGADKLIYYFEYCGGQSKHYFIPLRQGVKKWIWVYGPAFGGADVTSKRYANEIELHKGIGETRWQHPIIETEIEE